VSQIPEETRLALASLKVRVNAAGETTVIGYIFLDKTRASEAVARIVGMGEGVQAPAPQEVERQRIELFGSKIYFYTLSARP
jgi:hypothetical protein